MASYYSSGYGNQAGGDPGGGNAYYGYGQGQQQQSQPSVENQTGAEQPYGNPNQWHSQQSTQVQPQQANQQPSFWNPTTAATVAAMASSVAAGGVNNPDAMFDFASTAGKSFLASSSARMIPGLEAVMMNLRGYFAVDNRYVKGKMGRILFPFFTKSWKRLQTDSQGLAMNVSYGLPHSDGNAPDLYIPLMSFITYVLLCALVYGNAGQFSPQVLTQVASLCFGCQIAEVLGIRFAVYLLQAQIAMLDLLSYTGYKYLGLCVNMVAGLALNHFGMGKEAYYVFFVYTAIAASWFMLKTMANNIPVVAATGPKRDMVVLATAASQAVVMYVVGKTKFLS